MPTSKVRKKRVHHSHTGEPFQAATLAISEAALQLVKEAELRITKAAREGDRAALDAALAVHLDLRTGALGLITAWSRLTGNPDPTTGEPFD